VDDLLDHLRAPTLAEVRDAFDQARHLRIVARAPVRLPGVAGTLHLVAVPIGNPDDLTFRARETLGRVPVVAAEDTRHFATLARHHGIAARAISFHDHNEEARTPELLARLAAGDDVALVSDAGTPLVSDPGFRLVRAAIGAGIAVTSLPGASAVTTALTASGIPPHPFRFLGFLPRTAAARRALFDTVMRDTATLVAFEAPRRLADTVRDASEVLGDRAACLARNLTKPHERYQRGRLTTLLTELAAEDEVRGECTIVIAGAAGQGEDQGAAEADARLLVEGGAPARIVQELLVRRHRLSRRAAYALVLRLRQR
jgi:16S rRNA (cytidine1402-2'-O)-methyltransferase